jgi:hypothetical protein
MNETPDTANAPTPHAPHTPRAPGRRLTTLLAVTTAALLLAAVAGVVVHHGGQSAAATPRGYRRLVDRPDRLSLAVPAGWQEPPLNADALTSDIQGLRTSDPQLALLYDIALSALEKFQVGTFAVDGATRTSLFTYGTVDPKIRSVEQISSGPIVAQLNELGALNVGATRVRVPLGGAVQVSAELLIGGVTISELVDYLVVRGRLVVLVLSVRGTQPPHTLLHQIESTLAAA